MCSCRRRRPGDIAGGTTLISGDCMSLHWHRPIDTATLTMLGVLAVEALVYVHMFVYCAPSMDALIGDSPAFAGSCLPSSTFLYTTSLLPLVLVCLQYLADMRPDAAQLHDPILLPLNVAAHSGALQDVVGQAEVAPQREAPAIASAIRAAFSHSSLTSARSLLVAPGQQQASARTDTGSRGATPGGSRGARAGGFCVTFVTSEFPHPTFVAVTENMSEFITRRATGVRTSIVQLAHLPAVAAPFTVYVFLLDDIAVVDAFYRRVHCAPIPRRGNAVLRAEPRPLISAYPTCQVVVICHADVLRSRPSGAPPPPPSAPAPTSHSLRSVLVTQSTAFRTAAANSLGPRGDAQGKPHASHAFSRDSTGHDAAVFSQEASSAFARLQHGSYDVAWDARRSGATLPPLAPPGAASMNDHTSTHGELDSVSPAIARLLRPRGQRLVAYRTRARTGNSPPQGSTGSVATTPDHLPGTAVASPAPVMRASSPPHSSRLVATPSGRQVVPLRLATSRRSPQDAAKLAERRARWIRAIRAAARQFPRWERHLESNGLASAPPAEGLAATGPDGGLAAHLRTVSRRVVASLMQKRTDPEVCAVISRVLRVYPTLSCRPSSNTCSLSRAPRLASTRRRPMSHSHRLCSTRSAARLAPCCKWAASRWLRKTSSRLPYLE